MTIKNGDLPAMPMGLGCDGVYYNGHDLEGEYHNMNPPANGLTKREVFCLHNGVADTGDEELDAIIQKGNRHKTAMHMMASIITQGAPAFNHAAEDAVIAADALLAELERTK